MVDFIPHFKEVVPIPFKANNYEIKFQSLALNLYCEKIRLQNLALQMEIILTTNNKH